MKKLINEKQSFSPKVSAIGWNTFENSAGEAKVTKGYRDGNKQPTDPVVQGNRNVRVRHSRQTKSFNP